MRITEYDSWLPIGGALQQLVDGGLFQSLGSASAALQGPLELGMIRAFYALQANCQQPIEPIFRRDWQDTSAAEMTGVYGAPPNDKLVVVSVEDVNAWLDRLPATLSRSVPVDAEGGAQGIEPPKPDATNDEIDSFLEALRTEMGKVPAQDLAYTGFRDRFSDKFASKSRVRSRHKKIFGAQRPGPR